MINDQQLTGVRRRKPGDRERGVGQFPMRHDLLAIVLDAPNLAGFVVAVNVVPAQIRPLRAVINHAASDRARLRVRMLGRRQRKRMRPQLAVDVKRVAPLVNTPAVVFAGPNQMYRLPQILPVVANPNLPGQRVNGKPPRIAQAVGEQLGPRVRQVDKRIVRRDDVRLFRRAVADVDAQHTAEKVI